MKKYIVNLELLSPLITPLHNDTIWGHICWGIVRNEGNAALIDFLDENIKTPRIVISEAYPHNMLPMPLLKPVKPDLDIDLDEYSFRKKIRNRKYIPSKLFFENFNFSMKSLTDFFMKNKNFIDEKLSHITMEVQHNVINRIAGTVLSSENSAGLFTVKEMWYSKEGENNLFDLYVFSSYSKDRVEELIKWAFELGYGADRSVGRGNINVKSMEEITINVKGNRYLSLGNFILENSKNLNNFRYNLLTKYGKVSGILAFEGNPFKKPLLMYSKGSTFGYDGKLEYIGSIVDNIHKNEKIKHCAIAPVIPYNEVEN